ncbi:MAG: hypothetical protein HOV67_34710, partial [Kribbellaceae bacterium]|nr:hypothetical protein [Kribbellaceae bacterium]
RGIRQLRPGEAVPDTQPRRYGSGQGYIRLRWKVGTRQYVETYEHRVVDGHVTTAEHVHHRNRVRDDNRPENLEHLTAEEHGEEHRAESLERAQRMAARYEAGRTIPQLAREFELDTSTVCRRLADLGVSTRTMSDYAKPIDEKQVLAEYAKGRGYKAIGRELGVSLARVRAVVERSGVPLRGPGRVKGHGEAVGEKAARKLVRDRASGSCEIRIAEFCLGRAMSFHHRIRRSQGGPWTASNGLAVCGDGTRGCHGALTNPNGRHKEYEANGWILPRHADAAAVPALIHTITLGHGLILLDDEGMIAYAASTDLEAARGIPTVHHAG